MPEMFEIILTINDVLKNLKTYLRKVQTSIDKVLEKSKIYLFGSILSGDIVAGSDIDVLIISEIPKSHLKRAEIIAEIETKASLPMCHPFEFHLLRNDEFNVWKEIYNLKYEEFSKFT